jgi:hypothetical protein
MKHRYQFPACSVETLLFFDPVLLSANDYILSLCIKKITFYVLKLDTLLTLNTKVTACTYHGVFYESQHTYIRTWVCKWPLYEK